MIEIGTPFKHDNKEWRVDAIYSVKYVNQIGYVVTVGASRRRNNPLDDNWYRYIELIANGTPLGYSKA
jgi:hypothetical protein